MAEGVQGRADAAPHAIAVLTEGTGDTLPEVLADLRHNPPDYADADARLAAVAAALDRPATEGRPATAKIEIHSILGEARYNSWRGGPSLTDRLWNWLLRLLLTIFLTLHLGSLPGWALYILIGAAALLVAGVTGAIVRSGWTRTAPIAGTPEPTAATAARDRFGEADGLAARGEYAAALRALVAGVATEVSGRPYWDSSPLTVRELFRACDAWEQLRPLLQDFEAAVYGRRSVAADTYRRAERIAARFRNTRGAAA